MADTSLFKRLGRLFSSDVVIRNIGGDQLKVADVNQIQTTGRYQTNSLVDRISRLYIYNNKNIFNPNLNYQTLRIQLYSDYEAMVLHTPLQIRINWEEHEKIRQKIIALK